jgi:hypothetical protein
MLSLGFQKGVCEYLRSIQMGLQVKITPDSDDQSAGCKSVSRPVAALDLS